MFGDTLVDSSNERDRTAFDSDPTLETPRLLCPIELAGCPQLQLLFPMGNHSLSSRSGPLALSARRRVPLHPRHGAPSIERGETWQWTLRLKPASESIIGSIDLRTKRKRQSRLLARAPLARSGSDDRSLRSRHRFLV